MHPDRILETLAGQEMRKALVLPDHFHNPSSRRMRHSLAIGVNRWDRGIVLERDAQSLGNRGKA